MGIDETIFEELETTRENLNLRVSMWRSLKEWNALKANWIQGKFIEILTDEIKAKAEHYSRVVSKCQRGLPPNPVVERLRDTVSSFKDTMPVVIALKNPKLKEDHWSDIRTLIGRPTFEVDDKLTLQDLMNMNVYQYEKEMQEISTQATQEAVLEEQFNQLDLKWKSLEFKVVGYKTDQVKDVYILTEIDELFGLLDELLANLNNILGSRYLKRMRPKAEELHKQVLSAQEIIDDWLVCQRNWMYLENIFTSNIKKTLPTESQQLETVDKFFKLHMKKTNTTRTVWRCLPTGDAVFKKHKETLDKIQKALDNLLEMKRGLFPRFYFLSNDELLEILAKASDLASIQKHMKKCFDNIYKLDLGDDERSTMVFGIVSAEEEKLMLNKPVNTK
jgi:dynein heavy chain